MPAHRLASSFSTLPSRFRRPALVLAAVLPLFAATPARAGGAAAPAGHAPSTAAPAPGADPIDQLRMRLAERLGAARQPDARGGDIVRVSSRVAGPAAAAHDLVAAPRPAAVAVARRRAAPQKDVHWGYAGEGGPQAWGVLKPEFGLCASGQRQSPIDIRDGIAVDLEPVQFDYRASSFGVIDNGHTVQVNVAPGNFIRSGQRRYELRQFHFHRPSEERIDGRRFDMVVHLVHQDPEARLAVVAVLLQRGAAQDIVQTVWNNLPLERDQEVPANDVLDLNHLLPPDRGYYTYMGSLTTPPCTEGVLWMVLRQPVAVSQSQLDIFARLYPMNARPVQQAAGRLIKQSN